MMKRIYGLLLILIFCFSSCQNTDTNLEWINFEWVGTSINSRYIDRSAINIPVKIENIPCNFKAQFDLGARTQFSGNTIKPYLKIYPEFAAKLDANYTFMHKNHNCNRFKDLTIYLDKVPFKNRTIINSINYGSTIPKDSLLTPTSKRIGTIGIDLFSDKILIIDYPNKRMAVTDKMPSSKVVFSCDFKLENNFIKIPITINNEHEYIIFDTGSSNWELVTSKENWLSNANNEPSAKDSIEVRSWGIKHYMWWSKSKYDLLLGHKSFKDLNVYYGPSRLDDFFKREKVFGITGNRLFWNDIIVIDFINRKFMIVEE